MKRFWLGIALFVAFFVGFGLTNSGETADAYSGTLFGRAQYYGYFSNGYDAAGTYVFPRYYDNGGTLEALPTTINTASEFINFIVYTQYDLDGNGTTPQEKAGAAFIMNTMLYKMAPSGSRTLSSTDINNWIKLVNTASAQGHITWRTNFSYTLNSYYQGCGTSCGTNDDAFYSESGTMPSIVFRDENNTIAYVIKWICANPVGTSFLSLQTAWEGVGRTVVTDGSPDPGDTATSITTRPGDTVHFAHYIKNIGPGATSPDSISFSILDETGAVLQSSINSGTYTLNQEKLVDNGADIVVPLGVAPGSQYCRKILWDWKNSWGDGDGSTTYGVGAVACARVVADYDLVPSINVQVNGAASGGNIAEQGDSITFTYAVNNTGTTASNLTNCTVVGLSRAGYYNPPASPDSTSDGGYVPPGTGCPRTFASNTSTTLVSETITASTANSTICRSLFVNPASPSVGSRGAEVCAYITAKPYARAYGGDLAAGGGVETAPDTCSTNNGAAIIGWNKRPGGGNGGAGVQFAAYAMGKIFDTATSLNVGSPPSGLSFANKVSNIAIGDFGGAFGWAPCIKDYYATRPASTFGLPATITDMVTGSYGATGNTYFGGGGGIGVSERTSVYIDGDVYLNTDVVYSGNGSWNRDTIPSFRLIARGNIYIDLGVSQLDGLYVAQPKSDGTKGIIYTCASTVPALYTVPSLNGNLGSLCRKKLTVNGGFVAKQVQLLRTIGSLSQASAAEASTSANIAEVFNYNPTLWMIQPSSTSGTSTYDAINSLPPVL